MKDESLRSLSWLERRNSFDAGNPFEEEGVHAANGKSGQCKIGRSND
ncbi:hypothetical protein Mesci_0514 [Mesorhizobium ciceri biovar biserrulae WSM1271]|uniref:Uncharacterized protein n=1 Tax=Mesorhizobium ciceri biovar biserrulae (strain HAMBI 2942 / LMG 23838 / WSM1271) TaxID=765698 RepID=E8TCG0_MESCW|nr:hypothetical protein Mesci_0514 [Mesorhizobium ciceri biovar biserrulae WSM1271]